MFNKENCASIIEAMSKEQFHRDILRGVAAEPAFSRLVSIGIGAISEEEKQSICKQLIAVKVPVEYSTEVGFDESLASVANCITARSVRVC